MVNPTTKKDKAFGPENSAAHSEAANHSGLEAEVRPILEDTTVNAPTTINTGETVKITAS